METHPEALLVNSLITLFINNRSMYYKELTKFKDRTVIDCAIQTAVGTIHVMAIDEEMSLSDFWARCMLGYSRAEAGLPLE